MVGFYDLAETKVRSLVLILFSWSYSSLMSYAGRSKSDYRPPGVFGNAGSHSNVNNRKHGLEERKFVKPKADRQTYDGKTKRSHITRKAIDYNAVVMHHTFSRVFRRSALEYPTIHPDPAFIKYMLPPVSMQQCPASSITGKFVSRATNKEPEPVFIVNWTPDGRRLFTGNSKGEITLWNGMTFNFVTIIAAEQKSPVRAMEWTHSCDWLVTGNDSGYITYHDPNMTTAQKFEAHGDFIRGISFAPTDRYLVSCSDDQCLKVWDFHNPEIPIRNFKVKSEVRGVDWHPYNSLIVSGSKSHLVQLWDPKSKSDEPIHTLQTHKESVVKTFWNQNGNWFISASNDHSVRLYDIRTMKELQIFRYHIGGAVSSIAWHPFHEKTFVSADKKGNIVFWQVGSDEPQGRIVQSHRNYDPSVWDMKWHPFGHILCTGSNDCSTWFWCRNRPGDRMDDQYNDPKTHINNEDPTPPLPTGHFTDSISGLNFPYLEDSITYDKYKDIVPGIAGANPIPIDIPGLGNLTNNGNYINNPLPSYNGNIDDTCLIDPIKNYGKFSNHTRSGYSTNPSSYGPKQPIQINTISRRNIPNPTRSSLY